MLELVGEGDWGTLSLVFSPFVLGAIVLTSQKKRSGAYKNKREDEGWPPTDFFDPGWFEVLLTKCF